MSLLNGASSSEGDYQVPQNDIFTEPALQLWRTYQQASAILGQGIAKLGFLDLVVYGFQSTGKSSLLSALCGTKLPVGNETVTKCPIRIIVDGQDGGEKSVKLHIPGYDGIDLQEDGLTAELYERAMNQLSKGAMTTEELQIHVRHCFDRPPLNLVDLPGLISSRKADKYGNAATVERLAKIVLSGGADHRAVLPIMTVVPTSDLETVPTEFADGKSFLAVLTHLDHIEKDGDKIAGVKLLRSKLARAGCVGFFMVSLRGCKEADATFYDEFCKKHGNNAEETATFRSSCGVSNLLKRIQELQLQHVMEKRGEIMGKLSEKMGVIKPHMMKTEDMDSGKIRTTIRNAIASIQKDVADAHFGKKTTLGSSAINIADEYHLAYKSGNVLKAFAKKAVHIVLEEVLSSWRKGKADELVSMLRFADWVTPAWNIVTPGFYKIIDKNLFGTAKQSMLDSLKNFVAWRAEERFGERGMAPATDLLADFWSGYSDAKHDALQQEIEHLKQEVQDLDLASVAPWIYIMFEAQGDTFKALEGIYPQLYKDLMEEADLSELTATENKGYAATFAKDAKVAQRRTKLVALFGTMQLVEGLSKRMMNIIFARTYSQSPSADVLANQNLSQAFEAFLDTKEVDLAGLILPAQLKLTEDYDILAKLKEALEAFSKHAAGPSIWQGDYTPTGEEKGNASMRADEEATFEVFLTEEAADQSRQTFPETPAALERPQPAEASPVRPAQLPPSGAKNDVNDRFAEFKRNMRG